MSTMSTANTTLLCATRYSGSGVMPLKKSTSYDIDGNIYRELMIAVRVGR